MIKRLIVIPLLLLILTTNAQHVSHKRRKDQADVAMGVLRGIAGGAFIINGLAQQPDEKWIVDPNGKFYNMGQKGYWRKETFWEDRNRIAAVASGFFIMGLSIKIKF